MSSLFLPYRCSLQMLSKIITLETSSSLLFNKQIQPYACRYSPAETMSADVTIEIAQNTHTITWAGQHTATAPSFTIRYNIQSGAVEFETLRDGIAPQSTLSRSLNPAEITLPDAFAVLSSAYLIRTILGDVPMLLLHSSGVVRDNRVLLFAGPSGAGKSTIAGLQQKHPFLGVDFHLLYKNTAGWHAIDGGDLIRPCKGIFPCNLSFQGIEAIYFLEGFSRNAIRTLQPKEAMHMLQSQCEAFPVLKSTASYIDGLIQAATEIPCKGLSFEQSPRIWELLTSTKEHS